MKNKALFVMDEEKINKVKKELETYDENLEFKNLVQLAIEDVGELEYAFYDEGYYLISRYIVFYAYLRLVLKRNNDPDSLKRMIKEISKRNFVCCIQIGDEGKFLFY